MLAIQCTRKSVGCNLEDVFTFSVFPASSLWFSPRFHFNYFLHFSETAKPLFPSFFVLFLHRSLAPLSISTFSVTMLQSLLPDISLSSPLPTPPTPPFIFPSHVLNAYFYLFTFRDLYSKTIFLLRHSQPHLEARYLSVFLIFHQSVPAYSWTIGFLS